MELHEKTKEPGECPHSFYTMERTEEYSLMECIKCGEKKQYYKRNREKPI
jgi:hypothetical protein